VEDLDGDLPVVLEVLGEKDRGHAPSPQFAEDPVGGRKCRGQGGHLGCGVAGRGSRGERAARQHSPGRAAVHGEGVLQRALSARRTRALVAGDLWTPFTLLKSLDPRGHEGHRGTLSFQAVENWHARISSVLPATPVVYCCSRDQDSSRCRPCGAKPWFRLESAAATNGTDYRPTPEVARPSGMVDRQAE
jgi:hypothetical protein